MYLNLKHLIDRKPLPWPVSTSCVSNARTVRTYVQRSTRRKRRRSLDLLLCIAKQGSGRVSRVSSPETDTCLCFVMT